ncbi:muconate/chloromuconate family cycloisomerase [Dasania marina]|uniref:muconate/chloromuconate family cycloisomerase n=1 Tax=Dasania marina TaxID=471499 RepID=UPI0030D87F8B|tara:strand:- start:64646 stop:65773 length:1128 start_codon:yes stop_codon:yes gene_type:complete
MNATELTIEKFESFLLDVPTIRPHILSMATMHSQTIVLLRITFSDGTVGLGEASTIGGLAYGDESPEGIKVSLDSYFAPLLLNQPYKSVGGTMLRISKNIVGNRFAKNAIEIALMDAMGHRLGVPVSELLGGRIVDHIPVLWVLASGDLSKDIAEAEEMIASRRHNVFKIKIGKRSVDQDVAHVAAIKQALGDAASIRVDVNQAWTRWQANRGSAMLADAGIDLIEQPLRHDDIEGMKQLVQQGRIAIMADESVQGPKIAFDMTTAYSADVYSIKIAQSGGLSEAARVASIVSISGAAPYGGTMLEPHIGTMASAQLFSTFPSLEWGTELFAPLLLKEQYVNETLDYVDFGLTVPNSPGLGISLDEDKVSYFSRK